MLLSWRPCYHSVLLYSFLRVVLLVLVVALVVGCVPSTSSSFSSSVDRRHPLAPSCCNHGVLLFRLCRVVSRCVVSIVVRIVVLRSCSCCCPGVVAITVYCCFVCFALCHVVLFLLLFVLLFCVVVLVVERNTQVRRNYTTPHRTQMIDTTINLLVNRTECTNLSGTTLTLRLAVKSDNSSPAIPFRDSEKLDATIKLSLTLPTHSCRCPHGRTKSCFTHNNFSKFRKLRSL